MPILMFTTLILGMCAYWVTYAGMPFVAVGQVAGNNCNARLYIGNGGIGVYQEPNGREHMIVVAIGEKEALVIVDQQHFRVPAGTPL